MSREFIEYLKHIHLECEYIMSVVKSDTEMKDFIADETLKRAVMRSLEIIGEATKKVPVDIKLQWKGVAWKNMAGMRDRLIHDYMGVNYFIVWDVAKNLIPEIKQQVNEIINTR